MFSLSWYFFYYYFKGKVKQNIQNNLAWVSGLPMGEGGGGTRKFLSFTSLPFSLPSFPFSPETPDTQARITRLLTRLQSPLILPIEVDSRQELMGSCSRSYPQIPKLLWLSYFAANEIVKDERFCDLRWLKNKNVKWCKSNVWSGSKGTWLTLTPIVHQWRFLERSLPLTRPVWSMKEKSWKRDTEGFIDRLLRTSSTFVSQDR